MFKMVFEGDPGFDENDEVSVVSEIRVNSIVVFERVGPGKYQMRALAPDEIGMVTKTIKAVLFWAVLRSGLGV